MKKELPDDGTKIYGLFGSYYKGIFIDECVYEEKCKLSWGISFFSTKREANNRLQQLYDNRSAFV